MYPLPYPDVGTRTSIIKRFKDLAQEDGITMAQFCETTGFSEDQFYYWTGTGKKTGNPNGPQIAFMCWTYEWSPTYLLFGIGPKRLTEVAKLTKESNERVVILAKLEELLLK